MSRIDFDYFEQIIVYKSLTDASYLGKIVDYIQPEYFNNANIAKVFSVIKDFYVRTDKLPGISEIKAYLITEDLRNGFRFLLEGLKEIDKRFDKTELLKNTAQFIKEKAVFRTIMGVEADLGNGTLDTEALLQQFEKVCSINFDNDRGLDLFEDIEKVITELNAIDSYISTGWEWLDKQLGGGLLERGKALYVFAGETNVGKSIVLGNIATNVVLQGKTVLLITLEMSELVYATRLCSNITQIPIRDLRTDQQSLRSIMNMEKEKGGKLLIKEFPPSSITPAGLKSFVADIIASGIKIDCIVVDYINLLHSTIGSNSYERVKYITEQLRALSYFTNAPMVSATQLNRGGFGGKNPGLDTISESIGLAATADVIVMIFQSEEDRELNIIRFGLGKNRYGPKGMVYPMNMQYETLTIRDNGGEEEVMTDNALDSLDIFGE